VRVEPPETKPGEGAQYTLLVASPAGAVAAPAASYAFCATAKLLSENGAVTAACASGESVRPVADPASAVTPPDACAIFGPEIASADLRPRDPDPTGGYYQPLRVAVRGPDAGPLVAFGFVRLSCDLKSAPIEAAREFAERYRPNRNPTLSPLDPPLSAVDRGARVVLRAAWPPESAEAYVAFDPASQSVAPRREAMRVSWFSTGGSFESDRTGRAEDDPASFTENAWTAPDVPGAVHLWRVLRDSRGGVAFDEVVVEVR
jgi:hypothetical protein